MPIVTYNGTSYECTKAIKGNTYVELRDSTGAPTYRFDGVASFSSFSISDGSWSAPDGNTDIRATATLDDGNLVVVTDSEVGNGTCLKFEAPCNCENMTGKLIVNDVPYSIVDALDNEVPGKQAWCSGAEVSFLFNTATKKAYIQNQAMVGSVVRWGSISVPTSAWEQDAADGYYYASIAVSGMLASDNPHTVDIVRSGDPMTIKAALVAFSKVDRIETFNGSIKLRAPYTQPSTDFTLRMEGTR